MAREGQSRAGVARAGGMKHSTGKPTKAEAARMARLKEMPCLCCSQQKVPQPSPTEIHHLLSGNKRRGHLFTIPLCGWHHRGLLPSDEMFLIDDFARKCIGESLAWSPTKFRAHFGTDDELLARTNTLLETTQ